MLAATYLQGCDHGTAPLEISHKSDRTCAIDSSWSGRYVSFLQRHARVMRWSLLFGFFLGAFLSPKFVNRMVTKLPASPGTYSNWANELMNTYYAGKIEEDASAIVVHARKDGPVLGKNGDGSNLTYLTNHILQYISQLNGTHIVKRVDCWSCFSKYPSVQETFVSSNGSTSFIAVQADAVQDRGRLLPVLHDALNSLPDDVQSEFDVYITGNSAIDEASIAGIVNNLEYMDSVAFPSALVLLGVVVWSPRLMLLPVLSLFSAVVTCFGLLMYPISLIYSVFILACSLMMSLLIAMSIDYSLFMLTRFKEEFLAACCFDNTVIEWVKIALVHTVQTAGHTVLMSGATLVLSFLGLLLSMDPFFSSIGIGCAVALVSAMVSALVLIPVLLISFPRFFTFGLQPVAAGRYDVDIDLDSTSLEQAFEVNKPSSEDMRASSSLDEKQMRKLLSTRWYKFVTWMLSHKGLVSLFIGLLLLPCVARLPHLQLSNSPLNAAPQNNEAFDGFWQLQREFGAGLLWPTHILLVPPSNGTVFSHEFFERTSALLANLTRILPTQPAFKINSIVFTSQAGPIPFSAVQAALPELSQEDPLAALEAEAFCAAQPIACDLLRLGRERYVNPKGTAMIADLVLEDDPFSSEGIKWMKVLRSSLPDEAPDRIAVVSFQSSLSDTIDGLYAHAPIVLGVTTTVVFLVISASFGSLMVTLRLLPSIALSLLWTYGLAVLVYQDGILDWVGIRSLSRPPEAITPGIGWVLPALAFTPLVGLCLDYDIFVLNRIAEFRLAGYSDHDAVVLGVSATGHTITVAGSIMLIAFSGLLMSNEAVLNELSFFLIACVLLDTLVVRTMIVPICMDVMGQWSNWWPRRMPPPTKCL